MRFPVFVNGFGERDWVNETNPLWLVGCDHELVREHCRSAETDTRGCWVVDTILGKS